MPTVGKISADWSPSGGSPDLAAVARLPAEDVLAGLSTARIGLTSSEAVRRLALVGPNALRGHVVGPLGVLGSQLKNPFLLLLAATAVTSLVLKDQTDALIILGIVVLSVGLGFVSEYRSVRAIADLHARVLHTARTWRDGRLTALDVRMLVPGDVVVLDVGDIVPADLRLLDTQVLECDEAVLTGESGPVEKTATAAAVGASFSPSSCALMGTVIRAGTGRGVVVRTGPATQLGQIATRLGEQVPETAFQHGLRTFSGLLVWITTVVTSVVFVVNALVHHSVVESILFALAIAVSLTPQLLPAIVTVSLATGARRMAARSVLVKRLVSIEDLGNMVVLFTDKTGTLTEGHTTFAAALDPSGAPSPEVLRLGLLCSTASAAGDGVVAGGATSVLDAALWASPAARDLDFGRWRRIADAPFDYERRLMSVLVDDGTRRRLITKGAPESVLTRCAERPPALEALLTAQFAAGARVVAVATREAPELQAITPADERDLTPAGLLVFADPPKTDAAASIDRLQRLGITVKIVTGDNELVAKKICDDLGIAIGGTLTGTALAQMSDLQLTAALATTSIFARVSPEQKAKLIRLQRKTGVDVGFLGDGVNDAVALHDADVGISVESATDVAKDAADIVLVTKDLGLLADGVAEGRRIFANTIKYLVMGTSSNFGNMLSTAGGSLFLPFLPLLPSQVLLGNLLYDGSEMTIPTDNVDEEQLRRPAHWDMRLIRRFMSVFGPINSLFDYLIFAVMLLVFHAGPTLFRSGYFVETFVTQTLIIFALRTRRVPFLRSRPSWQLAVTTIGVAIVGAGLPFLPIGVPLGFAPLPPAFFGVLAGLMIVYIVLVDAAKTWFFRTIEPRPTTGPVAPPREHRRVRRVLARWRHPYRAVGIIPLR
ncbi:MAG TPA: magnesium-translocating P-type ATPase [bacterium]|nr:magnesium-translocating P-type ATPase [bacterium]